MDIQHAFSPFVPVCPVSKAVYTYTTEFWVLSQPFLWPEVVLVGRLSPRLSRAATQAMDKDEVDRGSVTSRSRFNPKDPLKLSSALASSPEASRAGLGLRDAVKPLNARSRRLRFSSADTRLLNCKFVSTPRCD
ncbi:MAG: hypothetical protein Q9201_006058 [Fulgogasparrea decipioides]